MALGCALVSSDVSGVRDVVQDGETGLIVPRGDSRALTGALKRFRDSREASRIGANAQRLVRERFDIKTIAPRYEALPSRRGTPSTETVASSLASTPEPQVYSKG